MDGQVAGTLQDRACGSHAPWEASRFGVEAGDLSILAIFPTRAGVPQVTPRITSDLPSRGRKWGRRPHSLSGKESQVALALVEGKAETTQLPTCQRPHSADPVHLNLAALF